MLIYNLSLIKYSPKKLEQLAGQLRGEVHNVLSFLRCCDRTKICTALSKFLLHILNDVAAKFGVNKRVIISECHTGRADIVSRVWFAARGKHARRRIRKTNLKLIALLV
ncbi:MAG: Ribosomal protein L22p [Candidatus Hodgkinia cicadicola]|nr:MAG: Ribosomal protein L22p [Candidatus Hodgkinia cicadicola]